MPRRMRSQIHPASRLTRKPGYPALLAMSSLGIACWLWMANPSPNDESRSKVSSPSTPQSALVNENIEEQAEFSDGEHQLMEQFLQLGKNPDQISFRVEFTESKQEKQITDLTRLPDVPFEVLEIGEMAERVRLNNAQIDLLPKFRRLRFLYLDGRDLKDRFTSQTGRHPATSKTSHFCGNPFPRTQKPGTISRRVHIFTTSRFIPWRLHQFR